MAEEREELKKSVARLVEWQRKLREAAGKSPPEEEEEEETE